MDDSRLVAIAILIPIIGYIAYANWRYWQHRASLSPEERKRFDAEKPSQEDDWW